LETAGSPVEMGSLGLAGTESIFLSLLIRTFFLGFLGFLVLVFLGVVVGAEAAGDLVGTFLEEILVKGHDVPTKSKVLPVGRHLYVVVGCQVFLLVACLACVLALYDLTVLRKHTLR